MNETSSMSTLPGSKMHCREADGTLELHLPANHLGALIRSAPILLATLLAAAGEPNVKEELLKGKKVGDMTYKVHLDAFNLLPYLTGETDECPRKGFIYF